MAIAHVHTDTTADLNGPLSPQNVSLPVGTVATDVVVLSFASGNTGTGAAGSWTAPAGWTSIGSLLNQGPNNSNISLQLWWALGNIANLSFTKNGTVNVAGWVISAFSGVNNSTPIDVAGTPNSNTGSASLTVNSVTTVSDQCWELIGFADTNQGVFTATNFTVSENNHLRQSAAVLYNTTPISPAGSTGTVAVTSSAPAGGQILIGVPFALEPAGGYNPGLAGFPYPTFPAGDRWPSRAIGYCKRLTFSFPGAFLFPRQRPVLLEG